MNVTIIGIPFNGDGTRPETENPARALRAAGLGAKLIAQGHSVRDIGDIGCNADVGWAWSRQQYADVVGVWGTWETPRTYYIDDIEIRITAVGTPAVS